MASPNYSTGAWPQVALERSVGAALLPLRLLLASPPTLFLVALTAMLLRHPDVKFFEVDRVAFVLLVLGVLGSSAITGKSCWFVEPASWPMLGLTILAIASVAGQPYDNQTWSLLAAKFIVPFTLFHLSALTFNNESALRKFEMFSLLVLAYLSFTSIAFLVGAKFLIWPHFILDESLGYHADRARGPLLQAVANGVSLNLLGLLAFHAWRRGRLRGVGAWLLLGSLPLAVLATMTRAVWLTFAGTVAILLWKLHGGKLRNAAMALACIGATGLTLVIILPDLGQALSERLEARGPVEFRMAVYEGSWQMFLERPLTGWGINQMPEQLARHVSGYHEAVLYPHNTYLELLAEHGIAGLGLYLWLMWELLRLGRQSARADSSGRLLDANFHSWWPVLLGVYWVNAVVVVMNYQFVNGLVFTMAGMLAAQHRRAARGGAVPC